jgi:hypothetical protein
MKVKFGAIITEGRGKINGFVASRNRAGAYVRTKVTPVNPSTSYQATVRARLAARSQAWSGLTAAQRTAWNASVSDFAKTDVFGDLQNPSGFNLYCALNNNLINIGESALTTPPTPQAVINFTSFSIAAANGAQTLTLTFADAIAATEKIIVYATPAVSAGKSFVKNLYRQIDVLTSADASPFSIETEYIARLGAIGAEGSKIFVKMLPISVASGQAGIPVSAEAIVSA